MCLWPSILTEYDVCLVWTFGDVDAQVCMSYSEIGYGETYVPPYIC